MPVPLRQGIKVASYVVGQKLRGNKHYPLVLMLEPLFRCNLECEGCGKIQYPEHILKKRVTAEQALAAADECGAPIVSIAGGEPLIHPEINAMVDGLIKQAVHNFGGVGNEAFAGLGRFKEYARMLVGDIILDKYKIQANNASGLVLSLCSSGSQPSVEQQLDFVQQQLGTVVAFAANARKEAPALSISRGTMCRSGRCLGCDVVGPLPDHGLQPQALRL